MMNVLNGGAHADNSVDFQEFMVVPAGSEDYPSCLKVGTEVFHELKSQLKAKGLSTAGGDEGGFAPDLESNRAALDFLVAAIEAAGYAPGRGRDDRDGPRDQRALRRRRLRPGARGPQADLRGAGRLLARAGGPLPDRLDRGRHGRGGLGGLEAPDREAPAHGTQLVGDDLFVTNPERLTRGIELGVGNSILVKVNQIGTLTETLEAIKIASDAGYTAVISHRSGETEDTTIADLAVGTRAGQIKTGAPVPLGPHGEVQPPAADRGGAGGRGGVPGRFGLRAVAAGPRCAGTGKPASEGRPAPDAAMLLPLCG